MLALDDDHSELVRRFGDDPLLGPSLRRLRGMRVLRVPTVAQSLLRALCGQLVTSREARALERRILRATMPRGPGGLCEPPTREALGALSPLRLRTLGLAERRAAALVRVCRTLDLERLREVPTEAAAPASSASARSAPGRQASSACRGSAGASAGSSATSAS